MESGVSGTALLKQTGQALLASSQQRTAIVQFQIIILLSTFQDIQFLKFQELVKVLAILEIQEIILFCFMVLGQPKIPLELAVLDLHTMVEVLPLELFVSMESTNENSRNS